MFTRNSHSTYLLVRFCLVFCSIRMESLIARLVERAQNASKAASPPVVTDSFAEPVEENNFTGVESRTPSVSQHDELSRLFIDILSSHSAIPIRVKIILDKILHVLDSNNMEFVYFNSKWSREDYNRGYKMEYDGVISNTFSMIDEQEAVDRLSAFILKSTSAQLCFTQGYAPPLCYMKKFPVMSISSDGKPAVAPVQLDQTRYVDTTPRDVVPDANVKPYMKMESQEDFQANGLDLLMRLEFGSSLVKGETAEPKLEVTGNSVADNLAYILKQNKRVSCDDCGKSFCDRGALKTHRSAVHLRQMHTCSVPGCGKQFNSTRSRDRHSANPNTKLHIPDPLSFRDSQRYPEQIIATRLMNDTEMPVLTPLLTTEPLDTPQEMEDTKATVPLLKKRPADVERYDEKRPATSEMYPSVSVPFVSPVMPHVALDLQMILLQQLAEANVPMFSPLP